MDNVVNNQKENNSLVLIPKIEKYMEYILEMLVKLPRTEKFNIGNEYKISMYKMLEETLMLNKITISGLENRRNNLSAYGNKQQYLETLNKIDVLLNCQRMYLRIMDRNHYIDHKKFNISMEYVYEIGKIVGGIFKYYAKNNTK